MGSVTKIYTKMNNEQAFRVFLSNLYYKLECNDSAFIDIMTNPKSNIAYPENNRFGMKVAIGVSEIRKRLQDFNGSLTGVQARKLYNEFLTKNNIQSNTKKTA